MNRQSFILRLGKEGRVIRGKLCTQAGQAAPTLVICHRFKGFKDWGFFPYTAEHLRSGFLQLSPSTFDEWCGRRTLPLYRAG